MNMNNLLILINRNHPVTEEYAPEDLAVVDIPSADEGEEFELRMEAKEALERMVNDAKKEGLSICGVAGYRSFETQKEIYTESIVKQGLTHTRMYIAFPGTSEHQTGLAVDLSTPICNNEVTQDFKDTKEYEWLLNNSYRYGFILRYPEGSENITGYGYESWHLRYVTVEHAKNIYDKKMVLEEYCQLV